ncbi:MAG: hypothetical protein U5J62_06450 [Desulfurivibrio sp.]|nr:hypothetical protein [Desulfurivibrio sp.]
MAVPTDHIKKADEEYADRSSFLEQLYQEWLKTQGAETRKGLALSRPILGNCVISYFDDIQRIKEYHYEIDRVDTHKIAAYTSKWIVFSRPISCRFKKLPLTRETKIIMLANELFALHCGLAIMGIEGIGCLDNKLRLNLLYTFKYRHFSGRTLATIYCLIDRLLNPQADLRHKGIDDNFH